MSLDPLPPFLPRHWPSDWPPSTLSAHDTQWIARAEWWANVADVAHHSASAGTPSNTTLYVPYNQWIAVQTDEWRTLRSTYVINHTYTSRRHTSWMQVWKTAWEMRVRWLMPASCGIVSFVKAKSLIPPLETSKDLTFEACGWGIGLCEF